MKKLTPDQKIIKILSDETEAKKIVNRYFTLNRAAIPFKHAGFNQLWATRREIAAIIPVNIDAVVGEVSRNQDFFKSIGVVKIQDESLRGQILQSPQLTSLYLYNGRAVFIFLLVHDLSFGQRMGFDHVPLAQIRKLWAGHKPVEVPA